MEFCSYFMNSSNGGSVSNEPPIPEGCRNPNARTDILVQTLGGSQTYIDVAVCCSTGSNKGNFKTTLRAKQKRYTGIASEEHGRELVVFLVNTSGFFHEDALEYMDSFKTEDNEELHRQLKSLYLQEINAVIAQYNVECFLAEARHRRNEFL